MSFTEISRRRVLDGQVWAIEQVEIKTPSGEIVTRDVLRHPGAVTVVPIDDKNMVHLVRQYRAALDDWIVEACAGRLDKPGEEPLGCAHRELAEELGLAAAEITHLTSILVSPGYSDELNHLYLARRLSVVERSADGVEEEHMEVVQVAIDDVPGMISRGEITDAKSVIALLMAHQIVHSE